MIDVVILAAGKGKRLLPFTKYTPKPLLKLNDKCLIQFLLEVLPEETQNIIIVVDYLGEQIINLIGQNFSGKQITYVWQDKTLPGTMGALISAKSEVKNEKFLVICADNLYSKKSLSQLTTIGNSYMTITISEKKRKEVYPFSKLSMWQHNDADMIVLDAGAWYLNKKIFDARKIEIGGSEEIGIPQSMKILSEEEKFQYSPVEADFWYPVGRLEELVIAEKKLNMKSNYWSVAVD